LKLDELGLVGRGKSKHRPRNDPTLYGGQYPFVQTGDVKGADLWLSHHTQTYSEAGLAQSKLWPAGTLCITIAANIAETAILKIPACFPDSIVGFIPHEGKADARFVKYYIDTIKLRMQNVSKGTTQDNLSVDKLLKFDFDVPDYPIQERIASVLCAYDDLIENNTRRIKILEEMAQRIYREWFVNLRFPGHEKTKMVESKMGRIPAKWRFGVLEDALVLQRGFDLPSSQRQPGSVPIYAATGINGYHNLAKVRKPGVITGRSGSLGSVMLIFEDFWPLNTTLWVKEFRQSNAAHSFFLLSDLKLTGFNSGAAVPTLNRNDIHGLPCLLPDRDTLDAFNELVLPVFHLRRILEQKTALLQKTRDFLLPKLISGDISVEHREIETVNQIS
jgi:type I restriction enzyme, S subunit